MERDEALGDYRDAVAGKIADFRKYMETYLLERAGYLENMVRTGMELLGEQMRRQGKEYVCYLYFSVLKTDLTAGRYRILVQGMDMRWYLDEEPAEAYVDAGELFAPLEALRNALEEADRGYGGAVNRYDVYNLLFDELPLLDSMVCHALRYILRDWEKKGIFDSVPRSPYWILKWGEYRDRSEFVLRTDRTQRPDAAWKEELARAKRDPETMVFGYWYRAELTGRNPEKLDMRFTTMEECVVKDTAFTGCNMEGSRFPKSRMSGCSFAGCNLSGADFRDCSFEKTSFAGAKLTGVVFPAQSVPFLGIDAAQLQEVRIYREESV